jgi:hypothetical protein
MPDKLDPLNLQPNKEDDLTPEDFIMAGEVEEKEEVEEPIDLVEIESESGAQPTQIKAFGRGARASAGELRHDEALKRPLNVSGQGATRTRTFHSKLNDAALAILDQSINEWVDSSEIEIKCVSSCIGIFEGKKPEPHLIVTVCY